MKQPQFLTSKMVPVSDEHGEGLLFTDTGQGQGQKHIHKINSANGSFPLDRSLLGTTGPSDFT